MIVMPRHLETPRLCLRAPVGRDAAALFDCLGNVRVMRYMAWPAANDIDDVTDFLADVAWGWSEGDDYTYALVAHDEHEPIGLASCQFADEGAELGFLLSPKRWGQGLATEAVDALIRAALQIEDLYRIWAVCDIDNAPSVRVFERLGLSYEGCLRRRSARPNLAGARGPRDDLIYARVR